MAQQGHRRTQESHSRLCGAAWKLSDNGFSMLRVHSLLPTGTSAIGALETLFLSEVHGGGIHAQVQSSGECLVLRPSHLGDVLCLGHWVTQWRSWRKRCTGCVSSGKMKRRLSESSLKIGRDNSMSHTKQQRRNSMRPWSNKQWRYTVKMEKAGSLGFLVPVSLEDLQLQKTF